MAASSFFPILSSICGWIYFTSWSFSFYPQPLLNFRRKSTSGTTVDFPLINCIGFAAYFISNIAFAYSPLIRSQYASRNHNLTPTVQINDIVFALHGLLMSILMTSQYLLHSSLWSFPYDRGTRPSRTILGTISGCIVGVLLVLVIVAASEGLGRGSGYGFQNDNLNTPRDDGLSIDKQLPGSDPAFGWCELDIIYALGFVKLVVTLVKYTPQAVVNHRNQSTQGWSIVTIWLDFAGGVLSIAQQIIDSRLQGDWSGVTGNPIKFALGLFTMLYDIIFMLQHYVLYRHRPEQGVGREREQLLAGWENI